MKISGLDQLPDNCSLHFHANGIKVRVSLNIERELLPYIPKGKVDRGDKFYVYWCSKEIPLAFCTPKNIRETYEYLLNNTMRNVREFKKQHLDSQIKKLESAQKEINFYGF